MEGAVLRHGAPTFKAKAHSGDSLRAPTAPNMRLVSFSSRFSIRFGSGAANLGFLGDIAPTPCVPWLFQWHYGSMDLRMHLIEQTDTVLWFTRLYSVGLYRNK